MILDEDFNLQFEEGVCDEILAGFLSECIRLIKDPSSNQEAKFFLQWENLWVRTDFPVKADRNEN